jgi:hypothetical protein
MKAAILSATLTVTTSLAYAAEIWASRDCGPYPYCVAIQGEIRDVNDVFYFYGLSMSFTPPKPIRGLHDISCPDGWCIRHFPERR